MDGYHIITETISDTQWWRVATNGKPIDGFIFRTSVDAEAHLHRTEFLDAHWRNVPSRLERTDYEIRCQAAGITPRTDDYLRSADGRFWIARATFAPYGAGPDPDGRNLTGHRLAQARLAATDAEHPPEPAPAPLFREPRIACPNCGAPTTSAQLMHASRGTACPECYDEMSD